jgi:hypothetical protein
MVIGIPCESEVTDSVWISNSSKDVLTTIGLYSEVSITISFLLLVPTVAGNYEQVVNMH